MIEVDVAVEEGANEGKETHEDCEEGSMAWEGKQIHQSRGNAGTIPNPPELAACTFSLAPAVASSTALASAALVSSCCLPEPFRLSSSILTRDSAV